MDEHGRVQPDPDEQLIESIREEAAAEAESQSVRKLQAMVDRVLKDHNPTSLEPVKRSLRKTKGKMRTCSYYLCDKCNTPIIKREDGYIFHGNVYVADPSERGGLIGNNFPAVAPGSMITVEDVEETVLCHKCVMEVLGLNKHYQPKNPAPSPTITQMEKAAKTISERRGGPVRYRSVDGTGLTPGRLPSTGRESGFSQADPLRYGGFSSLFS